MTAAPYNLRLAAWTQPASRPRTFGTGWIGPMRRNRRRRGEVGTHWQAACDAGAGAIQEIDARAAAADRPDRVCQHKDMSRKISKAPRSDRPLAAQDPERPGGAGNRGTRRDSP